MASLLGLMASTIGLFSLQNYPSGRGPRKTVIKHLQKHWQQKPAMAVINDSNPYSVLLPLHPLSLIGLSSCHPWPLVWPQNSPLYINVKFESAEPVSSKRGTNINDSTLLRPMARALAIDGLYFGGFPLIDSASVWTDTTHTVRIYFRLGYKSLILQIS